MEGRTPKVVSKTGASPIFLGWLFWWSQSQTLGRLEKFLEGRTPKVVSKTGASPIFLGWFFWWSQSQTLGRLEKFLEGRTPKLISTTGASPIFLGRFFWDGHPKVNLVSIGKKWWLNSHKKPWRLLLCGGWTAMKQKSGGWKATKFKGWWLDSQKHNKKHMLSHDNM